MVDVKVRAGWAILCVRNGCDIVRAERAVFCVRKSSKARSRNGGEFNLYAPNKAV